jgi:hypothetical protein
MRTPHLFVCDHVGQILQHPVRGHGKDAGYRLYVRAPGLQGQDVLSRFVQFVRDGRIDERSFGRT